MKSALMVFLLLMAAVIQSLLRSVGTVAFPVMPAVVVFYAFNSSMRRAQVVAMLAGFLQDALSSMPLGFSSFGFCIASWWIVSNREEWFAGAWLTHAVVGAVVSSGLVLLFALLLLTVEPSRVRLLYIPGRFIGSALLGAFVVPVIYRVCERLAARLGIGRFA